jgi:hypothetical protein
VRRVLLSIILGLTLLFGIGNTAVLAQSNSINSADDACAGLEDVTGESCAADDGSSGIQDAMKAVLNVLSFVAGFISIVSLIIAGLKYITSQGESAAITAARSSIIYAVIGLLVVVSSQVIVRFVLTETNDVLTSYNERTSVVLVSKP